LRVPDVALPANVMHYPCGSFQGQRLRTAAAVKELQGYKPNVVGAFTHRGSGVRTAYI